MKRSDSVKTRYLKRFGKRLQTVRKKAGISQEQLAHLAGVQRSYMGRIERGESNPPIYTLHKIIRVLEDKVPKLPYKWSYFK